ncbi:MAG: type II toxin-antitoxin system RelE/ParE family toxin [Bacteroidetes bacterium]|nr:type II toxin-antitoxin system RelE/ParE family toxin [Bacteroidota bacterium]
MAHYEIVFRKSVAKDLRGLPARDVQMILKAVDSLRTDPRPQQAEKLTDREQYRLRQGRYRVLYEVLDKGLIITVVKVAHRRESNR